MFPWCGETLILCPSSANCLKVRTDLLKKIFTQVYTGLLLFHFFYIIFFFCDYAIVNKIVSKLYRPATRTDLT